MRFSLTAYKLNSGVLSVPTRKLDHIPEEPQGYSLRSLTPVYWPNVDFSDVATLINSNIQQTVFYQILLKNRDKQATENDLDFWR